MVDETSHFIYKISLKYSVNILLLGLGQSNYYLIFWLCRSLAGKIGRSVVVTWASCSNLTFRFCTIMRPGEKLNYTLWHFFLHITSPPPHHHNSRRLGECVHYKSPRATAQMLAVHVEDDMSVFISPANSPVWRIFCSQLRGQRWPRCLGSVYIWAISTHSKKGWK
jgi:hypothetical protein